MNPLMISSIYRKPIVTSGSKRPIRRWKPQASHCRAPRCVRRALGMGNEHLLHSPCLRDETTDYAADTVPVFCSVAKFKTWDIRAESNEASNQRGSGHCVQAAWTVPQAGYRDPLGARPLLP